MYIHIQNRRAVCARVSSDSRERAGHRELRGAGITGKQHAHTRRPASARPPGFLCAARPSAALSLQPPSPQPTSPARAPHHHQPPSYPARIKPVAHRTEDDGPRPWEGGPQQGALHRRAEQRPERRQEERDAHPQPVAASADPDRAPKAHTNERTRSRPYSRSASRSLVRGEKRLHQNEREDSEISTRSGWNVSTRTHMRL